VERKREKCRPSAREKKSALRKKEAEGGIGPAPRRLANLSHDSVSKREGCEKRGEHRGRLSLLDRSHGYRKQQGGRAEGGEIR